jgi:AraC family transcriptional regulator of arabinose operon
MSESPHPYRPYCGKRKNVGAYQQPFSGVGIEFEPLGAPPADLGFTLHETGYWAHACDWNFPNVYSPFWRIYYDYQRRHCVRFGKQLTPLGPDRLLVIPNHQRFDCLGDPPVAKLWFAFSCRRNADPDQAMPIVMPANRTISAFADEFPGLLASRRADRRERIYQVSLSFVSYVLGQPQIRWQSSLPECIARVLAMIDADPAAASSLRVLAEEAGMSIDGFARSFRRWMHATPARYVQQVRVREACRLLAATAESIKKVAKHVGFANRHHFSRVFRELTGATPAAYRREHSRPDDPEAG